MGWRHLDLREKGYNTFESNLLTTESQSGDWVLEKHPRAFAIVSQLVDGDCSLWLANLGNPAMSLHVARETQAPVTLIKSVEKKGVGRGEADV